MNRMGWWRLRHSGTAGLAALALGAMVSVALPQRAMADQTPDAAYAQPVPDDQLQPLVAPIALYPDPLLATALAAAAYPDQIQAAAAWTAGHPDAPPDAIAAQDWDPSVQALAHYPGVLTYMNSQIDWTNSLGAAYSSDPGQVMGAVQDLRAQALAAGTLISTPQQIVNREGGQIYILPANPNFVYVPRYDPAQVYVAGGPPITFDAQLAVGPWLRFGLDWSAGVPFVGDWRGGFAFNGGRWGWTPGWRRPADFRPWARAGGPLRLAHPGHFAFVAGLNVRGWHVAAHVARPWGGAHPFVNRPGVAPAPGFRPDIAPAPRDRFGPGGPAAPGREAPVPHAGARPAGVDRAVDARDAHAAAADRDRDAAAHDRAADARDAHAAKDHAQDAKAAHDAAADKARDAGQKDKDDHK